MRQYYYSNGESRFIGPLLPFVGGLLVGGLITPRPNYQPYPYYYPQPYYPPVSYYPYPINSQQSYNVNNEIPTYYTSVTTNQANIYPYNTNPRY